ncbi:hypothetical protein GTU99_07980 [Streptomyces sp. PRKS01-65]|nr:hypothetical protein [Streptomyces harenosi]NEY32132.1 hypothetical protein [Streptomyces harenosi]
MTTLRATLNSMAAREPKWPADRVSSGWFDRYAIRFEDDRLPEGTARQTDAVCWLWCAGGRGGAGRRRRRFSLPDATGAGRNGLGASGGLCRGRVWLSCGFPIALAITHRLPRD